MTDWNPKANELFLEAVEIRSAEQRQAFLDEKCGNDSELRTDVESLLAANKDAGSFLEQPAAAALATVDMPPLTERVGTIIGPYKLLQQIGEGGFGVVYLAEQQEPVRRNVALKIIKPGMDTREVIARFSAERQALALMDHPNIAHVLDAGATESGRPYFVMELVRGVPITEYCDQCNLTTRARLELFVSVCQAVQHAHQKGIIHRDIKPTNVLIAMQDGSPAAKIIDFGVAKAINQRLTEQTLLTGFAQMVGTPLYMSPEQAEMSPMDVDTRSDIYSLGVMLYELLTGTTPFERSSFKQASYDEIRRIIREEEPPRPSHRLSTMGIALSTIAEHRRTDPRRLSQQVRRDLDWIVMKALEKDRTLRYETASNLAADVERYLNDEAVEARPPSALYQFRKFARRNRAALTTAALLLVTVVAGLAVSNVLIAQERNAAQTAAERERDAKEEAEEQRAEAEKQRIKADRQKKLAQSKADEAKKQRERAEENLRQARAAVDRWLTRAADDLSNHPHTTKIRETLLTDALKFYQGFLQQKGDDPVIRRETAFAYLRYSYILGQLERHEERIEPARQAVAIFEKLALEFQDSAEHRKLLADAYSSLAGCYFFSYRTAEAVETDKKALPIYKQMARDFPTVVAYRRAAAGAHTHLGNKLQRDGKHKEAEKHFRQALLEWEQFHKDFPHLDRETDIIAHAHHWLGSLLLATKRLDEAETHLRRTLALRKKFAVKSPDLPYVRFALGHIQLYLGDVLVAKNEFEEAEQLFRSSMQIYDRLHGQFPARPEYKSKFLWSLGSLNETLLKMGRTQEWEELLVRNLAIRKATFLKEVDADPVRIYDLAWVQYNLGLLRHQRNQIPEAANLFREAFENFDRALAEKPDLARFQNGLRWVLLTCPLEQFRDLPRGLKLSKQLLQHDPTSADHWNGMGLAHYRTGNWKEAVEALKKSIDLSGGGDSFNFYTLAMAHWQLDQKEDAREWYQRALAHQDNPFGPDNPDLLNFRAEAEKLMGIEKQKPRPLQPSD
jgi:serine/threonine protein kinase